MKCPNCNIEMTEHTTGKDIYFSDGDHEISFKRISIKVCPECNYSDEQTLMIVR